MEKILRKLYNREFIPFKFKTFKNGNIKDYLAPSFYNPMGSQDVWHTKYIR